MNFLNAMDIASSGLSAQRTNMNTISMNLANVQTTRTQDGGPYQRKEVLFEAAPVKHPFDKVMTSEMQREVKGVKVSRIQEDDRAFKDVYDPGHPDANDKGYVKYPDINVVEEMANMMTATRAYEANLSTISSVKQMINQAVQIGR